MLNPVQALVDALAAGLGQPVGLDDPRLRALAYSPHPDEVDAVRRATILRRATPADVGGWVLALGIETAEEPVPVPASRRFATVARICVPVRFQGALLGYLWLELGADAQAAAARVLVHRSSLYNRLRRIEHVAGVDLRSGDDRLELHLGLRIWRMTGGSTAVMPAALADG